MQKIYFKGKTASELSSHISKLHNLEHFSLKKDCNLKILQSLVGACSDNLKLLDVESCNFLQVTFCKWEAKIILHFSIQDEAVALILKCRKLNSLYMSGTNISDEGKARIIMGLPKLRNLVRADYLCDALGWIDYLEEVEDPVFDIREFIPSTSYFFHENNMDVSF